ncbi:MAG TPA: PaaI family thioesterase, partial [Anaerolineales bacterium]|nr:PaaI family thioesterase [Anaerolineales bacterium]
MMTGHPHKDAVPGSAQHPDDLTPGKNRVKQPNSRHCFVCGLESSVGLKLTFYDAGPDQAEAAYTVPEEYQGYPGVVHGGVVAAMLDEVIGRAAMSGDPNHFTLTARLALRYRKPIPVAVRLQLVGSIERKKGRLTTGRGELRLPDGTIAAEAEATLVDYAEAPEELGRLERLGWRVYED